MKPTVKFFSGLVLIFLVAPVLLLNGCGSESGAPAMLTVYEKCENWGNDTDFYDGTPGNGALTISPTFTGGQQHYEPLIYELSDAFRNPRNNVCVNFTTDGTFYLDEGHTMPITPSASGLTNIKLRTDDFGKIYVYWATEDLPSTPAAGQEDATGESWVTASSGSMTPHKFTITWTVTAQPAP